MDITTEILTSSAQLQTFDEQISNTELVAVDTETTGLERFREVVGISFSLNENEGVYIPIKIWNVKKQALLSPWENEELVFRYIQKWLTDSKKKWVGHNIQFDVISLMNTFGVNITPNVYSDTILLHHTCISEDPPHGLKPLAARYIDPSAQNAQDDLKESVLANGGLWKQKQKEMYKGDWRILGKYGALDTVYTMRLHNLWYPELKKQKLEELWNNEVLPLTEVMVELNTAGIKIDVSYFEKLKPELQATIKAIESEIYTELQDEISDYEYKKAVNKLTITPRSALGKQLISKGLCFTESEVLEEIVKDSGEKVTKVRKTFAPVKLEQYKNDVRAFYCQKEEVSHIFSFNSSDDKAFLFFDVLGLQSEAKTKGGKAAVDAKTMKAMVEDLEKELEDGEEGLEEEARATKIIKKVLKRAKEIKLLTTYVEPLTRIHINGRVYPSFQQSGTSSGRFTSSEPFNFLTLPSGDNRIKKGFIPDENTVFVAGDWAAVEPRIFSHMSAEPELIKVYKEQLDFYSKVYIMLFDANEYSAKEEDANFLKKVNPQARQHTKQFALGFCYGMSANKLAKVLNISIEEATRYRDMYFDKFKGLKTYMDICHKEIKYRGYVSTLTGRKRRARLIPFLQKECGIDVDNYRQVSSSYARCMAHPKFQDILATLDRKHKKPKTGKDLTYLVRNELNNACNHKIQGLAASMINRTSIELLKIFKKEKLKVSIILSIYDELVLRCKKEDGLRVSELLKYYMENNPVSRMLTVPMECNPVITDKSLAETK